MKCIDAWTVQYFSFFFFDSNPIQPHYWCYFSPSLFGRCQASQSSTTELSCYHRRSRPRRESRRWMAMYNSNALSVSVWQAREFERKKKLKWTEKRTPSRIEWGKIFKFHSDSCPCAVHIVSMLRFILDWFGFCGSGTSQDGTGQEEANQKPWPSMSIPFRTTVGRQQKSNWVAGQHGRNQGGSHQNLLEFPWYS